MGIGDFSMQVGHGALGCVSGSGSGGGGLEQGGGLVCVGILRGVRVCASESRVGAAVLECWALVHSRQIEGVAAISERALAILERRAFLQTLRMYVLERAPFVLESRAVLHFREVHGMQVRGVERASALFSRSCLREEGAFGGLGCDVHGGCVLVHVLVFVLVVELKAGIRALPILESRAFIDPCQADYFCTIERTLAFLESRALLDSLRVYVLKGTPVLLESRAFLHFREVHCMGVSGVEGAPALLSLPCLREERAFGGLSCDVHSSRMLVHACVLVLVHC